MHSEHTHGGTHVFPVMEALQVVIGKRLALRGVVLTLLLDALPVGE